MIRATRQQGFTLLELMVVVILIAVMATIAVLRVDRDFDRVAEQEARRFLALVQHARDESVLAGRTFGIEVDDNERSYWFTTANPWTQIADDPVLRKRIVPEPLTVEFEAETLSDEVKEEFGISTEEEENQEDDRENEEGEDEEENAEESDTEEAEAVAIPPIIINALGEITPFVFTVKGEKKSFNVSLGDEQELLIVDENADRI